MHPLHPNKIFYIKSSRGFQPGNPGFAERRKTENYAMKEKTKRKQMSLLDSIVDLILGYSDIDFEKIIQEEREKADRRRDRTPLEDRPHPTENSTAPAAFRIVTG